MLRGLAVIVATICLSTAALSADTPDYHQPGDLAPLQDPALRSTLHQAMCDLGLCSLAEADDLAVALAVVDEDGSARLAMLNGHHMMYAASLPKLAILLGAMVASQRGDLVIDDPLADDIQQMMRVSCNPCATRVLDRVGRQQLLDILREPEYDFYDETRSGGLWVGKDYASKDAYRRDPVANLSHGATAYQVARLYYRLNAGTLLDESHTSMMLSALSDPAIEHKFVAGLARYEGLALWRKSGTWRDYHADSALVKGPDAEYILVAMVDSPDGEIILQALAERLHLVVAQSGGGP
jgi:beta-lactamase class A